MKILFICRGNVGRSQMAEVLFNKISKKHKATSAGTKVNESEGMKLKDTPFVEPVIQFMKEEGFDISEKARRQVTREMIDEVDKVIVMAEIDTIPDFLIKHPKAIFFEVEDPKGKSLEDYKKIISKLKKIVRELEEKLPPE